MQLSVGDSILQCGANCMIEDRNPATAHEDTAASAAVIRDRRQREQDRHAHVVLMGLHLLSLVQPQAQGVCD